jgi:hypothetical protein
MSGGKLPLYVLQLGCTRAVTASALRIPQEGSNVDNVHKQRIYSVVKTTVINEGRTSMRALVPSSTACYV